MIFFVLFWRGLSADYVFFFSFLFFLAVYRCFTDCISNQNDANQRGIQAGKKCRHTKKFTLIQALNDPAPFPPSFFVISITSRCFGKWARDRTRDQARPSPDPAVYKLSTSVHLAPSLRYNRFLSKRWRKRLLLLLTKQKRLRYITFCLFAAFLSFVSFYFPRTHLGRGTSLLPYFLSILPVMATWSCATLFCRSCYPIREDL